MGIMQFLRQEGGRKMLVCKIPRQQMLIRLVKLLQLYCTLSIIVMMASPVGAVDNLAEWIGSYEYIAPPKHSTGGSPITMKYMLEIKKSSPSITAVLTIKGFQTDQKILCGVSSVDSGIAINFHSYDNGSIINEYGVVNHQPGDVLLNITRKFHKSEINTQWIGIDPPYPGMERQGNYFKRLPVIPSRN